MGEHVLHLESPWALRLVGTPPRESAPVASVELRLELPAEPESVRLVRQAACALASAVGIPDARLEDLKLAVTEAAANVVVHAYRDEESPGSIELGARSDDSCFVLSVSDRGSGPRPRLDSSGLGLGLGLMSALADGCRVGHRAGGGTHVELRFAFAAAG